MASLKTEVKAFIIQQLACFDTPSQIVVSVQKEFSLQITRQQVASHDPTKVAGKGLAKRWVDMFNATRERFQNETSDIPIANKAYRLRVLDRIASRTEEMKNFPLTVQVLEQAAKEMGGAYTNSKNVDVTSSDGSMTPSAPVYNVVKSETK